MIVKTKDKNGIIREYSVSTESKEGLGFPFDASFQQINCKPGEFFMGSCPFDIALKSRGKGEEIIDLETKSP